MSYIIISNRMRSLHVLIEHLALENLREDKDYIIVTADKGVTLVVMDKTEYIRKCEALLQDNPVYQHLSKDTSPTIHKELIKSWQDYKDSNFISETEYTCLRSHGSNSPVARFYGPKIHKNNMPMHPIVSACGKETYNTAKFITKIMQNYCGKTLSFVKDSEDFISKIKHLLINPEEETLVSFDVSAFFTSIPVYPKFLPVLISPMSTRSQQKNSPSFWNSLSINCIFCFNVKFYKQLQGVAMGSLVSLITANIDLEHFESLAIPTSPTLIKWWFRHDDDDDVHSATRKDQVNKLQEQLNSIDPHVRFTIKLPGTGGLSFLDTLTKPTPISIESTVYREPTHTDRDLDYSNHPISAKLSVICILIHRAGQVCSTGGSCLSQIFWEHENLSGLSIIWLIQLL